MEFDLVFGLPTDRDDFVESVDFDVWSNLSDLIDGDLGGLVSAYRLSLVIGVDVFVVDDDFDVLGWIARALQVWPAVGCR